MGNYEHIVHPIPPLYDKTSRILILGSFPSVKTREMKFFYGHPQNRFWFVMADLFREAYPATAEERRLFLLRHHIAAWDVIGECDIIGSSDSSIRNVRANDLRPILDAAPVRKIYTNGKTAFRLYQKYILPVTGREAVCLPSTSPANAAVRLPQLTEEWRAILAPLAE